MQGQLLQDWGAADGLLTHTVTVTLALALALTLALTLTLTSHPRPSPFNLTQGRLMGCSPS